MQRRCIACVMVTLSIAAAPAYAQSLADLARAEEARRASAPKAGRSFSNADLEPGAIVTASAPDVSSAESCYMSKSLGRCATAEEVLNISQQIVAGERQQVEAGWRKNAAEIRDEILRLTPRLTEIETLMASEGRSASQRAATAKLLEQTRTALQNAERRWLALETNAAENNIPRAWLEPVPAISSRNPQ